MSHSWTLISFCLLLHFYVNGASEKENWREGSCSVYHKKNDFYANLVIFVFIRALALMSHGKNLLTFNCNSPGYSQGKKSRLLSPHCKVSIRVDLFTIKFRFLVRAKKNKITTNEITGKLKVSDDNESWDFSHIKSLLRDWQLSVLISARNKMRTKLQLGNESSILSARSSVDENQNYFGHPREINDTFWLDAGL